MVIGDVREGKFNWLPPEYEETVLHPPSISEILKTYFCILQLFRLVVYKHLICNNIVSVG